jgi:putative SOS response-associated peptidase YedK
MCGRASLTMDPDEIARVLGLDEIPDLPPRFNIAPSQPVPIIRAGTRHIEMVPWGPRVMVRGEHLKSPQRRAVFVLDGFYEWTSRGKTRHPSHLHLPDHGLFTIAALYDDRGASVITRDAVGAASTIHDRMPVILNETSRAAWLSPSSTPEDLQAALRCQAPNLVVMPVSTFVNSARNEGPHCYDPPSQPELPAWRERSD